MGNSVSMSEWKKRFEAIGMDGAKMSLWHSLFERENPSGHQSFLEWLGVSADEIARIRKESK